MTPYFSDGQVTLSKRELSRLRTARYRARKKGEDVPFLPLGPRQGLKQTPEHIAKRVRRGAEHPQWKGDAIDVRGARKRAERNYPVGACSKCGSPKAERHHLDRNIRNNNPENIAVLCHPCHMAIHAQMRRAARNV